MDIDNAHRMKLAESRIKDWLYFDDGNIHFGLSPGKHLLDLTELGLQDCDVLDIPDRVKKISFSRNHFEKLPPLKDSIEELTYNDCFIKEITSFPPNLKQLYLGNNYIEKIENLPDSIEILYLHDSWCLETLPPLPKNLKKLVLCSSPGIKKLPPLPPNLETLCLDSMNLEYLPNLPKNLKNLTLNGSKIKELPFLPDSLETLQIAKTNIQVLPNIPKNFKFIWCRMCPKLKIQKKDNEYEKSYLKRWIPVIQEEEKKRAIQRCKGVKGDLMAATWHPDRYQDWCIDIQEHELMKNPTVENWLQYEP